MEKLANKINAKQKEKTKSKWAYSNIITMLWAFLLRRMCYTELFLERYEVSYFVLNFSFPTATVDGSRVASGLIEKCSRFNHNKLQIEISIFKY